MGPVDRACRPRASLLSALCVVALAMLAGPLPAGAAAWRPVTLPLPAGASSATLNAVACVRASACWAVGTESIRHRGDRSLAERWNGRRWRSEPVAVPARLRANGLFGVACTGPSMCMAVGATAGGEGGTLVERLDGGRWAPIAAPSPGGSGLGAISCPSASFCLAVGNSGLFDSTGIFNYSLNLVWNGTTWTREPYGETGFQNAVSCATAVFCAAVGDLADSGGYSTVTEQWDGTAIADAPSGDGHNGDLQGVSCVSASSCMAVGTDEGDDVSLWNGRRWSFVDGPGGLDTVDCVGADRCIAAGLQSEARTFFPRVARWDDGRWSVERVPHVAHAALNAITCSGATDCLAVGSDGSDGSDGSRMFALSDT